MDATKAQRILDDIEAAAQSHPDLVDLLLEVKRCAVSYAHIRARSAFLTRAERANGDAHRSRMHDAFIEACNALSRAMVSAGMGNDWRAKAGADRKEIGDLASHLHCILGIQHR